MNLDAVIDNDILIKSACYSVLSDVLAQFATAGVLGAARYVVGHRLERDENIRDRSGAVARWVLFLSQVEELEPTESEVALATSLEDVAAREGLALDTGESQLCAIAISRVAPLLVTGDKRAIAALERLLPAVPALAELAGRVVCLEQLLQWISESRELDDLQALVCAEPDVDRAVAISFRCLGPLPSVVDVSGLESYVADVRRSAPTLLLDGPLVIA